MILSEPIAWALVPRGAVVLGADGTPREVLDIWNIELRGTFTVLLAAWPPFTVLATDTVRLAALDEADAVAALARAGLNPEIISKETS